MSSELDRPKYLTKNAVKNIVNEEKTESLEDQNLILQIISVKDVSNKKNIKHKLVISDGTNKILCVVKEEINKNHDKDYKALDIIRVNAFVIKTVKTTKLICPTKDFDVIANDIDVLIGKPKEYKAEEEDSSMDFDAEIPYKQTKEMIKEAEEEKVIDSDVDMKGTTPAKEEAKDEVKPTSVETLFKDKFPDMDDMYTPIKSLSPMHSDWIIKARVSKKYPVKEWNNARGSGKLLNIELVDRYGTQIQATLFNKAVDKYDPILEQDKVYMFSKGTVKIANAKFTAIKNDYSLTFSPFSDITLTEDDNTISNVAFNFSNLSEVKTKGEGKALDLIGIVTQTFECSTINLKNGGTKDKRDYEIIDNSQEGGIKTIITLWGSQAAKFNYPPGSVLAFKGLRVANFKGITLNGGDYTGVFDATELNLKEVGPLQEWYKRSQKEIANAQSLTESQDGNKKPSLSNVRLIKEVIENVDNDLGNDPTTKYYINARVEMIKNDPKMVYMACPSCKKKMQEEDSGYTVFRCERCNMTSTSPVPTYILSVKVGDATGSLWIRVHGDTALPIMNNISAKDFNGILQQPDDAKEQEIKDTLGGLAFKEYSISLKPSISEYNGQMSTSYFAQRVFDFSSKKSNDFLIDRLYSYKRKEDIQVS